MSNAYFNPLPPHGGRLPEDSVPAREPLQFQSTPSAWRETPFYGFIFPPGHISIHSLRMEGDVLGYSNTRDALAISIHSLRMEGDSPDFLIQLATQLFQSTPSAWRETGTVAETNFAQPISIHSLRMEGDHHQEYAIPGDLRFQSTPSAWRETAFRCRPCQYSNQFQSTPSAWRETRNSPEYRTAWLFQSTPSAWRETDASQPPNSPAIFQSTPSAWRETLP